MIKVKFATIWLHNTVIIPTRLDKSWFWNCDQPDAHSGDQFFLRVHGWELILREKKLRCPPPQCRLIVVSKISEQRLRFWLGFVCQVQKAIQHLTWKCEMLSQNSTLFLDTVQVVQEKVMLFLFLKTWAGSREILLLMGFTIIKE